jgi:hypothetical protein
MHCRELNRPRFSTTMVDKCAIVPILACVFALIVAPLLIFLNPPGPQTLDASLALFIILYSYFESLWISGFEFLWMVFVILAAEVGRYWRPLPLRNAAYRSRSPKTGRSWPLTRRAESSAAP